MIRKIYGPIRSAYGTCRIQMNHELDKIIGGDDVVRYIKSLRIAWIGHVELTDESRIVKGLMSGNLSRKE